VKGAKISNKVKGANKKLNFIIFTLKKYAPHNNNL